MLPYAAVAMILAVASLPTATLTVTLDDPITDVARPTMTGATSLNGLMVSNRTHMLFCTHTMFYVVSITVSNTKIQLNVIHNHTYL